MKRKKQAETIIPSKVISTVTIRHIESENGTPFIEISATGIKELEIISIIELAKYKMLKQSDV